MRKSLLFLCTILVLPAMLPGRGFAGIVEPGFEETLASMPEGHYVHSIVMMAERVDTKSLLHSLRHTRSLAVRHTTVTSTLMEKALSTQTPLLQYLETQKRIGRVLDYTPFWITNMIAVTGTKDVVFDIAARFDVGIVFEDFEVFQMEPVSVQPAESDLTGHEPGLEGIRATELWEMGITGAGVLVCNVDTGVDGNHAALASRWRGLDPGVDPGAAWYDPVTSTDFPFDSGSHGTHTMGTITGRAGTDTIGVAPDAKWIAAGVIDRVSGTPRFAVYAGAIQWTADPDGDPETTDDIPDVVSNSWGINTDLPACDTTFWEAIDNCEAAGAIIVFAAGNEGPSSASLRNPADRIDSPVNVMAVGALLENQTSIADYSSRGPSTCDDVTKKPEVCAQGDNVRSSVPGGYEYMSGTSMACPHVAGAIALLRQLDPNATPEDVKTAILETAFDLGTAGEDNNYGMGRVDLVEAAAWLGGLDELAGTVTDAVTGDTLEGAQVELPEVQVIDSTDTSGFYSFHMILPDTVLVVTKKFGYEIDSSVVIIVQDSVTVHDVLLTPVATGTLQGNVRDIDTSDGISADVQIFWTGINVANITTNPVTGFYSVNLPAGFYDVTVIPVNPYIGQTVNDVEIVENQTAVLDFTFQAVTIFNDVSSSSGIEMGGHGQGCAWGDFDRDGDEDIYVTNILGVNRLLENSGGTFTDVAPTKGVADAGDSFGACWGDYDRDGDLDLFVAVRNAANRLYRNDGATFTDIALSVGITDVGYHQGAAWLDFNLDGLLDLYVVNRITADKLYRNDGGTFTDVTDAMGIVDSGTGSGVGIADYNSDGYPDIYVLKRGSANVLYRNDVSVFTDVTSETGVGGGNRYSNGCAWGDFDNDGDQDLYVANSGSENVLFRNDGGVFIDISVSSGTNSAEPSYHAIWVDYDSDADLDLFVTNSTTSLLYLNTGGGNFMEVGSIAGTDVTVGGGAGVADFNQDGRIDLYVVRISDVDDVLLENNGNFNTWLNVALRGVASNRHGIGAKVFVTAGGVTSMREVTGGNGFFSHDSFTQHFGLMREITVDQVTVEWPSGRTTTLQNVAANQKITIAEAKAFRVPFAN
jgi:bacillopeptidase F